MDVGNNLQSYYAYNYSMYLNMLMMKEQLVGIVVYLICVVTILIVFIVYICSEI